MSKVDATRFAGEVLRRLIKENYSSQEEFAFEFGADVRTISRYINNGITKGMLFFWCFLILIQALEAIWRHRRG